MRWNTGAQKCLRTIIVNLHDFSDLVNSGDDIGGRMRHGKFDEVANGAKQGAQFIHQGLETGLLQRGNLHGIWIFLRELRDELAVFKAIGFIENHQCGFPARAQFTKHLVDHGNLFVGQRVADVDDVHQQIGLHDFFQRRLE